MKPLPAVILTLLVAVPATWFAARHLGPSQSGHTGHEAPAERKPMFYQSAMHPWIKSDKPGRCTICGMELTPVYEGDQGPGGAAGVNIVPLPQSVIQVLNVQTADVVVRKLNRTLKVAGTIDDDTTRHRVLSAYIPGRIDRLHVNFIGAEVITGQPLAEFYSPMLLQAEREYRTLDGPLREATAVRLRQFGLSREQIEAIATKPSDALTSQILSPVTGTVVEKSVFEGQYVQEGEKLFEIADFSTMWFQFRAYEQDMPWLRPGLEVDVTTPAIQDRTFTGRITFIDPNFDDRTRSTKVRVELDNPLVDGRRLLLHRLYADGVVRIGTPEVLSVPRSALIETGAEAVVYIDHGGGSYERRRVQTGRRGDMHAEVISGLSAGEKVVVNGNLLIDGQAEINRSFATPAASDGSNSSKQPAGRSVLLPAQETAVLEFLALVDSVTTALASDHLEGFNAAAARLHEGLPRLRNAFSDADAAWHPHLKAVEDSGHLEAATDLKAARKAFQPLSAAAVALVQSTWKAGAGLRNVRVYRCPMTKDAFPGAPARAEWIQLKPQIRNPYYGAEMLDCGSEVKP